jgi:hypothetical protein
MIRYFNTGRALNGLIRLAFFKHQGDDREVSSLAGISATGYSQQDGCDNSFFIYDLP